ncbi:MAG TPA: HEAT repeat domain-containing protein [Polyangiaceae bacterium]|nr:HEAT repeat domain-containing protein [Polyangiaceae bacterium]
MSANVGHLEKVRALAASGRVLAVGGVRAAEGSQLTLFDLVANKPLASADLPAHVLGLAARGDVVAAACSDGRVRLYAAADASLVREWAAHAGGAHAVALSPDGAWVASAGADGALRLVSTADGAERARWALSALPLRAVAIDPEGEHVGAAGDDGVVRTVHRATGAVREMPGHAGPVYCLAFTPRDGRVASGGDDGTVRLWYLVGDVESEVRGEDQSTGHAGGVFALAFAPTPPPDEQGNDPGDRLFSAGADGKVKVWRLADRRKPRTLDLGQQAIYGLCHAATGAPGSLGAIVAGGDRRALHRYNLDAAGNPGDQATVYQHGFQALQEGLSGAKVKREATVKALAALPEPEALELALQALTKDREADVRALAAAELASRGRRGARAALRERLNDEAAVARSAALEALRSLDAETPLEPLTAALGSKHADLRRKALGLIAEQKDTSPLVSGLVARGLTDADGGVRLVALDRLVGLSPPGSAEPLRLAFDRGPADVRVDVLMRAAFGGLLSTTAIAPLVARALDDDDAGVRRVAFAVKVLERRALAHVLRERDEGVAQALREIGRRAVAVRSGLLGLLEAREGKGGAKGPAEPSDQAVADALGAIPGVGRAGAELGEDDLVPLLSAMACRSPDTALRGARGLAKLGDTRALGALLQLSREGAPALRREAAASLQDLSDPRAKKRLVWMLNDADADVRRAALRALERFEGAGSIAIAEASLRSSQEDVRVSGLDALVKLGAGGEPGAEAEQLLGDALEDEAPKVREEAFRTLWAWHARAPERALERALGGRFADVRLRAVRELEALGKDQAWARARLHAAVGDRDLGVGRAAYEALVKLEGKGEPAAHVEAAASVHAPLRAEGARGAAEAPLEAVRGPLMRLLADDEPAPRIAALESLDRLAPAEGGPLYAGLQSSHYDLKVRAAELLAVRRDEQLIDAMRGLLVDKSLEPRFPAAALADWRTRAAMALATLGSPRTIKYLATELIKDALPLVREQAARGLATACRKGDEGYLLDHLAHAEVAVRSWAAEGLARLGDARALPVLTGTLRDKHQPLRVGAVLGFAALGPEGYGGMLQGLEDPAREVQEYVFAVLLARDLRAFRRGEPPDLLASALSSQRPDVRFAAARALEMRADPERYLAHLIEALMPPRPEKAADMKEWPPEEARGRLVVGLAEALAGDLPDQRHAAANVLRLRGKPLEFFREARRVGRPRLAGASFTPDTAPRAEAETDAKPPKGWLRRLFAEGAEGAKGGAAAGEVPDAERDRLRLLAFGAYVGLLRQVAAGDDEGHRVRRDAIDRVVELAQAGAVGASAAMPPLLRALDDPHHLVRRAAFAGLKKLFPEGSDEPLGLALASTSADVARGALDELAARGEVARPRLEAALNAPLADVRKYAFELLERLGPKGSLEPLLAALRSDHPDVRVGVLERLTGAQDPRVVEALGRALRSDHADLRLRAAELLASRRDDQAVDVLAALLRSDDANAARRAREALLNLGSPAAVRAIAARVAELGAAEPARLELVKALGRLRGAEALEASAALFGDESDAVRAAAFEAARALAGAKKRRDPALALRYLREAARAKDATLRRRAAEGLGEGAEPEANELLAALFRDRDLEVRKAAVAQYARRVRAFGAPAAPLEEVLRGGARDLMLAAAEGVAERGSSAALRPLLLFVRAGEGGERERALVALGTLGDRRALEELETVAGGGTKEAPADASMQAAALEGLGRLERKLESTEARQRVRGRIEQALEAGSGPLAEASVRALRHIGGDWARSRLEGALDNPGAAHAVRLAAADALGRLGDREAEAALVRGLGDRQPQLRFACRRALTRLFFDEPTRVALAGLASEHRDVSEPAAAYLAREGEPEQLLPRLASLESEALRRRLLFGLLRRASLPLEALARLLGHEKAETRGDAAWLLAARDEAASGGAGLPADAVVRAEAASAAAWARAAPERRAAEERAWRAVVALGVRARLAALAPRLGELAAGGDAVPDALRRLGVEGLAELGDAKGREPLARALSDRDPGVRATAARALRGALGREAAALARKVEPFDPVAFAGAVEAPSAELVASSEGRRMALGVAFAEGKGLAHLRALALAGPDDPTRVAAIEALGWAGDAASRELLSAIAFDKKGAPLPLRKAAYRALKRAKRRADKAARNEVNA